VQQKTKHVVDEDGARVGALTQQSAAGLQKSKATDSNPHLEKMSEKHPGAVSNLAYTKFSLRRRYLKKINKSKTELAEMQKIK
jgi:hypothetical protein